jgi:hypothetical protein
MEKYWYKNAMIYSVHVQTFKDGNGNGTDLKGLTQSLDYLSGSDIHMSASFFHRPAATMAMTSAITSTLIRVAVGGSTCCTQPHR